MSSNQETILDKPLGGLFLMIIMSTIWTLIGTVNIQGHDYYIITSILILFILFYIYFYLQLNKQRKNLPKIQIEEDSKKEKLYWIIFVAEGVAILLAKNILANIHRDDLFIPTLALIVGLHFFPLAKVFKRRFDYYIGAWTTLVALTGIILTIKQVLTTDLSNSIVSFACAFSTLSYGFRMILEAKKLLKINRQ